MNPRAYAVALAKYFAVFALSLVVAVFLAGDSPLLGLAVILAGIWTGARYGKREIARARAAQ